MRETTQSTCATIEPMTGLGITITSVTVLVLLAEFLRHRHAPLAGYGWLGLMTLGLAEWLVFRGFQPVTIYFTPIAWTAYLLLSDAAVLAIRGHSRLTISHVSSLESRCFRSLSGWFSRRTTCAWGTGLI